MANYEKFQYISNSEKEIRFPRTPSTWVGEPNYRDILRLRVTAGGGMGGSLWVEYVDRNDYRVVNVGGVEMVEYHRVGTMGSSPERVTLNPKNIVSIEEFELIICTYYSRNPYFEIGEHTLYLIANDGHRVRLVNEF